MHKPTRNFFLISQMAYMCLTKKKTLFFFYYGEKGMYGAFGGFLAQIFGKSKPNFLVDLSIHGLGTMFI